MSLLRLLLDAVLDFLYPRIDCVCCGKRLEKSALQGICGNCMEYMPFIRDPKCSLCGKPIFEENSAEEHSEPSGKQICTECRFHVHNYDQALAVFEYSITIKELIHRYKYDGEYGLSRTFGFFMSELLKKSGWDIHMIIPVPLHKNRLKSRGFNQAALLSDYLSQRSGIPSAEDVLIRCVDTKTQTGFNRYQRAENLKNAFTVVNPPAVKGRNILLIDDVHTTGATVDSCSRVLHQAGAGKVYVITIASVLSE